FDQVHRPERGSVAARGLARAPTEHRSNFFDVGVGHGGEDRRSPNRRRHSLRKAASERREVGGFNPLEAATSRHEIIPRRGSFPRSTARTSHANSTPAPSSRPRKQGRRDRSPAPSAS